MAEKPSVEATAKTPMRSRRGVATSFPEDSEISAYAELFGEALFEIDHSGRITYVNETAGQLFEVPPENLIGKKFLTLIAKESQKVSVSEFHKTLNGGSSEYRLTLANGVFAQIKSRPLRDKNGHIIGAFGKATDISKQKQTEDALQKVVYQYRTLIEGPLFAMIIHDVAPYFVTQKAA